MLLEKLRDRMTLDERLKDDRGIGGLKRFIGGPRGARRETQAPETRREKGGKACRYCIYTIESYLEMNLPPAGTAVPCVERL